MGLTVYVYRDADDNYDCTRNGVTKRFTRLCVTNVEGPFEPDDKTPAVKLVEGNLPNTVKIVPDEVGDQWSMFGGNYAAASDSRLADAVEKITGRRNSIVAVHDRVECVAEAATDTYQYRGGHQ